jgi:flagellar protein FliL
MAKEKKPKPEAAPEGEGAEGGAAPKKKLAGKQLVLFIALPALLVLGGGGGAAYYFLVAKKPAAEAPAADGEHAKSEDGKDKDGKEKEKDKEKDKSAKKDDKKGEKKDGEEGGGREMTVTDGPNGEAFLTLPDILVNVAGTAGARPSFLKLKVTLQVGDAEVAEAIKPALPRVLDQYTGFLRELRMEDLQGSAGFSRLQLELLRRVNLAVAPAVVDAVLIEDMLVQ